MLSESLHNISQQILSNQMKERLNKKSGEDILSPYEIPFISLMERTNKKYINYSIIDGVVGELLNSIES